MSAKLPPIPPALLDLLRQVWEVESYQHWDVAWDRADRRTRPSYYVLRHGHGPEEPTGALCHSEAEALARAGLLAGLVRWREDGSLLLNEHASHAINDFASETYAAWAKLRERLEAARKVAP